MEIITKRNIPEKVVRVSCRGYNVIIVNAKLSPEEQKEYIKKIKDENNNERVIS